jgi:hypothetical protein
VGSSAKVTSSDATRLPIFLAYIELAISTLRAPSMLDVGFTRLPRKSGSTMRSNLPCSPKTGSMAREANSPALSPVFLACMPERVGAQQTA